MIENAFICCAISRHSDVRGNTHECTKREERERCKFESGPSFFPSLLVQYPTGQTFFDPDILCTVRARLDCLTKPHYIMHLTKSGQLKLQEKDMFTTGTIYKAFRLLMSEHIIQYVFETFLFCSFCWK